MFKYYQQDFLNFKNYSQFDWLSKFDAETIDHFEPVPCIKVTLDLFKSLPASQPR